MDEMEKYVTPVFAESYYVNQSDCEGICQAALNEDGNYFVKILVFLRKDAENTTLKIKKIFCKPKGTGRKLRLIVSDKTTLNKSETKSNIESFLEIVGCPVDVYIEKLNINTISKDDFIIFAGNKRKILGKWRIHWKQKIVRFLI